MTHSAPRMWRSETRGTDRADEGRGTWTGSWRRYTARTKTRKGRTLAAHGVEFPVDFGRKPNEEGGNTGSSPVPWGYLRIV